MTAPESSTLRQKAWALAWPMILSNASVPMLGLVDTAILGHLDRTVYLAAVALGASALSFLYWGFGFLRMGTTGETAQASGRGADLLSVLLRSMLLALLIAALLLVGRGWFADTALSLMAPAGEMRALAARYCELRLLSAPAVLATYSLIGWFIGRGDTRIPLLVMVSVNALNIPLDWLLIVELGLNSDGAAIATVIADYTGLALAGGCAIRTIRRERLGTALATIANLDALRRTLAVNTDLFIRTVALLFAFAFFHSRGALLGESIVAANAILMNLLMLTAFGLDGFALAAESLVGRAVGARQHGQMTAAVSECARWSMLTALMFTLLYIGASPWTAQLFSASPEVQRLVDAHYGWLVVLPLLAAPSYLFDGVFVGATRGHDMRNSMLLSVLVIYLPCWYLTRDAGNHGLWASFSLFSLARGLSLGWLYRRSGQGSTWLEPLRTHPGRAV